MMKDFAVESGVLGRGVANADIERTTRLIVAKVNLVGVQRQNFMVVKEVLEVCRVVHGDANGLVVREVRQHHPVPRGDQHVLALDVAVAADALPVTHLQGAHQLVCHHPRLLQVREEGARGQAVVQVGGEVLAGQQVHGRGGQADQARRGLDAHLVRQQEGALGGGEGPQPSCTPSPPRTRRPRASCRTS